MRARTGFVVAGVVLAGLVAIAIIAARARHRIEERLATAAARQSRLQSELRRRERPSVEASLPATAKLAPSSTAPKPPTNPETALPARIRPPGLLDFARDNPQLWTVFIQSKRAELGRLNLPLLQRLNLSPLQQERFRDILAADVARGSDIGAAADAKGLEHTDSAIVALRQESEQRRNRELAELLGPAGFAEFDAYQRALPVRGFVDGLATQVAESAPLSTTQADQLEQVLAEASEPYRNGQHADPESLDWEQVDWRAREILTPEQFAAWQLGVAHNTIGGSRRWQELHAVYRVAVKRMQRIDGAGR